MRATPFSAEELERFCGGDIMDAFGNSDKTIAIQLAQEVEYQREWLAYVARVIEAQTFDLAKLAKCRREALEGIVTTVRRLVVGDMVQPPVGMSREYQAVLRDGKTL